MPFINATNAKELSKLGVQARLTKRTNPEPMPTIGPKLDLTIDHYLAKRLTRTRKQIDALCSLIDNETDPQKLDRLASALARLSEIERQLANRPLPGSFKPTAIRAPKPTQVEPLD